MFKKYYYLTKPGIIYGNVITATAGFLLAAKDHVHFWLLLATLLGISLIIASACVFNNYIDRNIDKSMQRTKNRALVINSISGRSAIIYAAVLGTLGFIILAVYVNWLTLLIGCVSFIVYVVLYGYYKRRSVHGTIVGSISGAAPIVAGYCAVTDHFNTVALLLFLILVFWQMPHFYSIAIYRLKDYVKAKIPVLPAVKGVRAAKNQIITYIIGFLVANVALTLLGYTRIIYLAVMVLLSLAWLTLGLKGFNSNDKQWARKMFLSSLIIILSFSVVLSLSPHLP